MARQHNNSPNVDLYLAMTLRKMALGHEQTQELMDLEDAMDEVWKKLLDVEIEEINALIPRAFSEIQALASPKAPSTKESRVSLITRSVDVSFIGQAFRQVMVENPDHWQMKDQSPFVPMIVDTLARLPDLAPSDAQHGQAFIKVLEHPDHVWSETPVWAFINMVAQRAAELAEQSEASEKNRKFTSAGDSLVSG